MFGKPEDKFVALGSPKFDKAINSKPEDFELPPEWQRLIMKPDGTKKKVFFYNTTIGAILEGGEKYLQKVRHVLGVFHDAQDVVLWWRPHPLNEATYQAMRPRLLTEYERIIEDYKQECWGIFDGSSNLHRAIAWSDVYYGDVSSVMAMFDAVGKPVVVQNVGVGEGFWNKVLFYDFFLVNNDIWFCDKHSNSFFKMNRETLKYEYIESFDPLPIFSYVVGTLYNEQVYFTPFMANEISKVKELEPNFIEGESRLHPTTYVFVQNIGSIIYAYAGKDGTFIEYDCKTQKKREKILKHSPPMLKKIKLSTLYKEKAKKLLYKDIEKCQKVWEYYYHEHRWFVLSDYNSTKKQLFSKMNNNADGTAGKRIFDFLK